MINQALLSPQSIVVVGASNNIQKPGGKILKNIKDGNFAGKLYVSNPKEDQVQGIKSYRDLDDLPPTDLAVLAIAAKFCTETVRLLAQKKNTKAFIIISAGFSEESARGKQTEQELVEIVEQHNACLIGPNCIGVLNQNYSGVFTTPIPRLSPKGVDFISGSGATAVFIIESGVPKGLSFSSVFSVGNSAQTGVEDVLEYMDTHFDAQTDSHIKLLYIESIAKPRKLLKHAASLIRKGCRIAAVKAGGSEAGSRAASSHTGALASSDAAVDALFAKAGIVRCHSREELTTVASIFMHPPLKGENIAVITHAGGPAVMLTDALSRGGLKVPPLKSPELLKALYPGSSVANPIDFLATGTAEQLGTIIDFCDKKFDNIDAMAVIFGSPGLFEVYDVYQLLHEKMKHASKPVFPVLPSVINVKSEIEEFLAKGRINFPDEVAFGNALAKVWKTPAPQPENIEMPEIDRVLVRQIIENAENGYLSPENVQQLLDATGIPRAGERVESDREKAMQAAGELGFPVVMKVVGPVHKSDVGGVQLNVKTAKEVAQHFNRMMKIPDTHAVLLQPMLSGTELFAGAKHEGGFGHLVMCGLGGIFIEVLKDVAMRLAPLTENEAFEMIRALKSYPIIKGTRGQEPVDEAAFAETLMRLSALLNAAPEIAEMDLNPLLGAPTGVVAVDARIRIEK